MSAYKILSIRDSEGKSVRIQFKFGDFEMKSYVIGDEIEDINGLSLDSPVKVPGLNDVSIPSDLEENRFFEVVIFRSKIIEAQEISESEYDVIDEKYLGTPTV